MTHQADRHVLSRDMPRTGRRLTGSHERTTTSGICFISSASRGSHNRRLSADVITRRRACDVISDHRFYTLPDHCSPSTDHRSAAILGVIRPPRRRRPHHSARRLAVSLRRRGLLGAAERKMRSESQGAAPAYGSGVLIVTRFLRSLASLLTNDSAAMLTRDRQTSLRA